MIKKIITGFAGGFLYVLTTWMATLTGMMDWLERLKIHQATQGISILAPFSLMAIFVFGTLYVYHKWQPQEKEKKTFFKLMIIGLSFSFFSTIMQISLMYFDGIEIQNSLIIAALFFAATLIISMLTSVFYLFIKPIKQTSRQMS
jgi:hypothetical protein